MSFIDCVPCGGTGKIFVPDDPNAYFNKWAPLAAQKRSFQDQAQLDALCRARDVFVFNPATGTNTLTTTPSPISPWFKYDAGMGAAKLLLPKRYDWGLKNADGSFKYPELAPFGRLGGEGIHSKGALHIPVSLTSGVATFVWDVRWGFDFQTNRGMRDAFKWLLLFYPLGKIYQVFHEQYSPSTVLNAAARAAGAISYHHDDSEGIIDSDMRWPDATARGVAPGVKTTDPWVPTGVPGMPTRSFLTYGDRWTRYALEIKLSCPYNEFPEWEAATGTTMVPLFAKSATGTPVPVEYDRVTLYVWDEVRPKQAVIYRVPFVHATQNIAPIPPGIQAFRFAWDCSTENQKTIDGVRTYQPDMGATGDATAHVRNWFMLKAEATDPTLFELPLPKP